MCTHHKILLFVGSILQCCFKYREVLRSWIRLMNPTNLTTFFKRFDFSHRITYSRSSKNWQILFVFFTIGYRYNFLNKLQSIDIIQLIPPWLRTHRRIWAGAWGELAPSNIVIAPPKCCRVLCENIWYNILTNCTVTAVLYL